MFGRALKYDMKAVWKLWWVIAVSVGGLTVISSFILRFVLSFADKLEESCIDTLNDGIMTKDLVGLVEPGFKATAVNTIEFIKAIRARLEKKLA